MTKRTPARRIGSVLCCIIALLLAAGCETPVGVERLDASTAQRRLTANVLTTDELSPQARNVLRRWVLSERYDDDPAGAIAALHAIATDGRGGEDEVIILAEMAYLALSRQRASARKGARPGQSSRRCNGVLPLRCRFGSEDPQRRSGDEVPLKVEIVVNGGVHAEKVLGRSG